MEQGVWVLAMTALGLGAFHAFVGPDHYLPFVAIARTKQWSTTRTLWVVSICGVGHVLSSIVLGAAFIAIGYAMDHFELWESRRGDLAAWTLFSAGLLYTIWALIQLIRKKTKTHNHFDTEESNKKSITFWVLFAVFIFGPCEPLAGLLYTASEFNTSSVVLISLLFSISTIGVMIIMTLLLLKGFNYMKAHKLEKFRHLIAGITIALCGGGIIFLGL